MTSLTLYSQWRRKAVPGKVLCWSLWVEKIWILNDVRTSLSLCWPHCWWSGATYLACEVEDIKKDSTKMKMSQLLAGVIGPFSLIWRTLVVRVKKAIEVTTCSHVVWSYLEISMVNVMRYRPSSGMKNCSWVGIWLVKMSRKKGHRVPPSQALRHSKLMRPDKHS